MLYVTTAAARKWRLASNSFNMIIIACLASILITSCENENHDPSAVTGKLISHSECKDFKSLGFDPVTPDTLSCVAFIYDSSTNLLRLTHINAGFNCCPGKLTCNVSVVNDTIVVEEMEKDQACDCDCLFDLEIEIHGVEMLNYQLEFIEPYVGNQQKLIIGLNLTTETEGFYCVARKQYPWGIN